MQRPVGNKLHTFFQVHGIFSTIVGVALWLLPERTTQGLGWSAEAALSTLVFVRLLGAAFIAIGFTSLRARRSSSWEDVRLLVELQEAFYLFGVLALIVNAFTLNWVMPVIGWIALAVFALFACAFGLALYRRRTRRVNIRWLYRH